MIHTNNIAAPLMSFPVLRDKEGFMFLHGVLSDRRLGGKI